MCEKLMVESNEWTLIGRKRNEGKVYKVEQDTRRESGKRSEHKGSMKMSERSEGKHEDKRGSMESKKYG